MGFDFNQKNNRQPDLCYVYCAHKAYKDQNFCFNIKKGFNITPLLLALTIVQCSPAYSSVAIIRSIMMEVFCNRFPLVTNNLLDMLDNTTLLSCKEANRELNNFIKNEKLVWLRIIRLYKGNIIGFEVFHRI